MTGDHERYAGWAAAYTLGALDPEDRHDFERHLAQCPTCRLEVAGFAPLPALIAKVDPDELGAPVDAAAAAAVEHRARSEVGRLRARVRRWRAATALATAAAAVVAVVLLSRGDDDPTPLPVRVVASQTESASIAALERDWGTEIHVDLAGVPWREAYELWAVDAAGRWSSAATWAPTEPATASVTGSTSIAAPDLARIVVTSDDLADVLVDAAP